VVTLDLRSLVSLLTERVGIGGRLQKALPASAAKVTILRSDQLDVAEKGLKALRGLPFVLVGLSFVLFAGALSFSRRTGVGRPCARTASGSSPRAPRRCSPARSQVSRW
jgi:hypothetical protein